MDGTAAVKLHAEVLTPTQRHALTLLAPFSTETGFYLAGGAALALQLGHRQTEDLDWFRREGFDPAALAGDLEAAEVPFETSFTAPDTLWGRVKRVKTSFIWYRYPLIREPIEWKKHDIELASLEDIACMKLSAIGQRSARRDFVDIYVLGRKIPLKAMLRLYQKKFGTEDVAHVLFALTYFKDADRQPMPKMKTPAAWRDIKKTIEAWVVDAVR